MLKERKIKCDCGTCLQPKMAAFEGFEAEAMVCPKCGFTTLTKEQAVRFVRLKTLHEIIDDERKIIRVGNSMGITLPEQLKEFGIKIGAKVRTEALSSKSFKVELIG